MNIIILSTNTGMATTMNTIMTIIMVQGIITKNHTVTRMAMSTGIWLRLWRSSTSVT